MPRWILPVFIMEVKKLIAYRADFWINFFVSRLAILAVHMLLWKSIFQINKVSELNGMTLNYIILYYVVSGAFTRVIRGHDLGLISTEIYEGGLTKYLIYPTNFILFKIITNMASVALYFLQSFVYIGITLYFLGSPEGITIDVLTSLQAIFVLFLGSLLFFTMFMCLEFVTFWADKTWSLLVMLRFILQFVGGGMIPLTFFPDAAREIIYYTPFPYLIAFPVDIFFGKIPTFEILQGCFLMTIWGVIFSYCAYLIWNRGKYKYTGVGI